MVFALASVRRDRASENTVRLQLGNFGLWGLFAPQRQASVYLQRSRAAEADVQRRKRRPFIVSVCLQTLPGRPDGVRFGVGTSG